MTSQSLNRACGVDVLAVMRAEIERAGSDGFPAGRALIAARAAVAELIEATKQISNLYGHLWDVTEPSGAGFLSPESVTKYDAAHERLYAALAAVEGKA